MQTTITMKHLLAIITLFSACTLQAQEEKRVTGLLLLSSFRSDAPFDLFYPCQLDTTRTLQSNIEAAGTATPFLVTIEDEALLQSLLAESETLKNRALDIKDDDMEKLLVIPVEVTLEERKGVKFARNEKDSFLDWPVKLYNRTLFQSYNVRRQFIQDVSVVPLRKG